MRSIATIGALAVFAAAPAFAQGKFRTGDINPTRRTPTTVEGQVLGGVLGRDQGTTQDTRKSDHVPPGQLPPAGMCRVWIDGVPPGQQPAPTDCQTAVATKPANARVIWGDQTAFPGKGKGKSGKHGLDKQKSGRIDRDRGHDEGIDVDEGRNENRGRGKSVAKRGKKG
jgi:hypothetical protein